MTVTISQALSTGVAQLVASPSADIDAKYLLCHVLACSPSYLFTWPDKALTESQQKQFEQLLSERAAGKPVAHIIGRRGFWSLDLAVSDATLIPRPDTELLVELCLDVLRPEMRCIDLGTGTGAIILALANEHPDIFCWATDMSLPALMLARHNAQTHRLGNVAFVQSHWLTAFQPRQFDLIVSNPPYIAEDDPHLKSGDVRFEPLTALVSGKDGLDDIRQIIQQASEALKPGGWLIIEHGYDQGAAVTQLFRDGGFEQVTLHQDLAGQDRAVKGQLKV